MTDEQRQGILKAYNTRRYKYALEMIHDLNEDPAEDPDISYLYGLCYTKLEEYDKALLYLEQAVVHHWNLLLVYQSRMVLAYIYAVTGRHRLAKFELEQLLKGGYESPQVYAASGYIEYALGNVDESLSFLQKALTMEPDNPNALNSIGYIMAEEGLDNATALSYTRAAVDKNPDHASYLDSLGWALFKAGKPDEAKYYLKKALAKSGGHQLVSDHMRVLLDSLES